MGLVAYDMQDGHVKWNIAKLEGNASSPSIDPSGNLYTLELGVEPY